MGFDVRRGGEDEPFKDVRRGGGGYFRFPPWGGGVWIFSGMTQLVQTQNRRLTEKNIDRQLTVLFMIFCSGLAKI